MSASSKKIRNNYYIRQKECKLGTLERWDIEEEIRDILFDKGYDLINFCNAPCKHGHFNAIDCYSTIAPKLASEIKKHGFEVILRKNPDKRSISWIIFPFNLTHEIRNVVEDFEVIK